MVAHLREFVGGDFTSAREVQLRTRQGDRDEALAALVPLCHSHEFATWPLDNAAQTIAQAGWAAALKQTLREAVRDGDCHPQVAVAWGQHFDLRADRDLDDCLAALDQSHARSGDYAALDLKAELLAGARRYDEALAVARASAGTPPFAIRARGRQAWIAKQRGRADEAIETMRQVVRDDAGYYWGWSQLAEWFSQGRRHRDHLEAAERLVELAPANGWTYAHRAEARRDLGNRVGAKEDLTHAQQLAPGYEWAVFELFHMQMQDKEYAAAADTLKKTTGHIHPKEVALRQVQLAAAQRDQHCALAQITMLADGSAERSYTVTQATETLLSAGWAAELAPALGERLTLADPAIGTAWVRALFAANASRVHSTVKQRLAEGNVSTQCAIGICDGLIAGKSPESVAMVVKYCAKQCRADTWGWASMGRIYGKMHDDAKAGRG
jgi:tetratricopeptide (TPR) repeat protein